MLVAARSSFVDRPSQGEECTQGRSEWVQIRGVHRSAAEFLDCSCRTGHRPCFERVERASDPRHAESRAQRRHGEITKEMPGVR